MRSRRLEVFAFFAGLVLGFCALVIGVLSIIDAAFPGNGGEWAALGKLVGLLVDIPSGLIVLALAFTQRPPRHRIALFTLAALVLACPVAAEAAMRIHSAVYRRRLERMTPRPPPRHAEISIWPATAPELKAGPDSESTRTAPSQVAGRPWLYISNVSRPTITVYAPAGRNTGTAVVVFPGGGYQILAIDLEGTEACDWLTSIGVTCVLLKYRVPNNGPDWDQECGCFRRTHSSMALEDAQRAISLARYHAADWHIDPHKIGVLGFSAGGHMVASVSTRYDHRVYEPVDSVDQVSCRPDFAVALYPGHLYLHRESRFNPDIRVTRDTPPTFLVQAEDDNVDGPSNTLFYYMALKDAGVPAEMHMYAGGRHAFGLRQTSFPITSWPRLVETWLKTIGMVTG